MKALRVCEQYIDGLRTAVTAKYLRKTTVLPSCFYSLDDSSSSKKEKSVLYRHLRAKILSCGPISVADYMKETLTHPTAGYYMTRDVFGKGGDFITSPEISQLFGELIAVWIINEWRKISKDPLQLVELGPGRGTLIKHILQVFKKLRLANAVSIHLVEVSPALSLIQAKTLCKSFEECDSKPNKDQAGSVSCYRKGVTENGVRIYWYYSVKDVPKKFSVFLAHEFFDALPIHKFQKTDKGWNEVLVDVIKETDEERFQFVLSGVPTPASMMYISNDEKRDHIEVSPQTLVITEYISLFLKEYGGFALIADYGHNGEKTDTFRGFYQHKLHDPLVNPGSADLTADVDFSLLKKIAEKDDKVITFGPVTQRNFLKNLGIDVRLHILLKHASDDQKKQLLSGYHMITDEDKMGNRFKVLSLFPSVLKNYSEHWSVTGFDIENDNKV